MRDEDPVYATAVVSLGQRVRGLVESRPRREVLIASAAVFVAGAIAMHVEWLIGHFLGMLALLFGMVLVVSAGVGLGAAARWPALSKPALIVGGVLGFVVMVWIGSKRVEVQAWESRAGVDYVDRFSGWGRTIYYRTMVHPDGTRGSGGMSASGKPHGEWYVQDGGRSGKVWFWFGDEITEGEWHLRNK